MLFHRPLENIVAPRRKLHLRAGLLVFSLVALPFSASGGGRVPSPRPPEVVRFFTSMQTKRKRRRCVFFLFGCGGGIFHCPLENIVVPRRKLHLRAGLLVFSLVALPFSASGGGRVPSPRPPEVVRFFTSMQTKRKRRRCVFFLFGCGGGI